MRRPALAALALAAAALGATPASASAPGGRLFVEAHEFRFVLSRVVVRPGPVLVQLRNAGQDGHDLVIRRRGLTRGSSFGKQVPGALAERDLKLTRGTYDLLCTLPGHAKLGMRATLRVR